MEGMREGGRIGGRVRLVPMMVMVPPRRAAKESGMRSFESGTLLHRAHYGVRGLGISGRSKGGWG